MAAMFVLAIAVPEAFHDRPGGLMGPVVVAVAYLAVRLLHLGIFWLAARSDGDRGLRRQLIRFAPSVFGSTAVLLVASQLDGTAQTLTWLAALVVDYVGTILGGASGWRLRSASHFAERHGLVIIVALGESVVAIGVGVAAVPVSWPIVVGSALGLALAATLWWGYFDVVSIVAERILRRSEGEARARLARDAYSYLHLPMVAGIVLVALGVEQVLHAVGVTSDHGLSRALDPLPVGAMFGGLALFLVAHVAFKWRVWRRVTIRRVVVALVLVGAIWPMTAVPALLSLAIAAVLMVAMIASEAVRYAAEREWIRHEDRAGTPVVGDPDRPHHVG
jgi:low temperature requirement protein LtrA